MRFEFVTPICVLLFVSCSSMSLRGRQSGTRGIFDSERIMEVFSNPAVMSLTSGVAFSAITSLVTTMSMDVIEESMEKDTNKIMERLDEISRKIESMENGSASSRDGFDYSVPRHYFTQ